MVSLYQETNFCCGFQISKLQWKFALRLKYSKLWPKCNKTSAIYNCLFSDTKWKSIKILSGFVMLKNRIVIDSIVGSFLDVWPLYLKQEIYIFMLVFMRIFSLKLCIFLTRGIFYVKINITEPPGHKKFSWKMPISESHSLLHFLCVPTL